MSEITKIEITKIYEMMDSHEELLRTAVDKAEQLKHIEAMLVLTGITVLAGKLDMILTTMLEILQKLEK